MPGAAPTIISYAIAALFAIQPVSASAASLTTTVGGTAVQSGSRAEGYLESSKDLAPTEWAPEDSHIAISKQMFASATHLAQVTPQDVKRAVNLALAFFTAHNIQRPSVIHIQVRQDPEDGRHYLRIEFPISVGTSDELADLDFDLSMKVAEQFDTGTERLLVGIVRA